MFFEYIYNWSNWQNPTNIFILFFQTFGPEDPSFEVSLVHKIDANGLSVNGHHHRNNRNNVNFVSSAGGSRTDSPIQDDPHWDELMNGGDWSPERCALAEKTKRKWLAKANSTKGLITSSSAALTEKERFTITVIKLENGDIAQGTTTTTSPSSSPADSAPRTTSGGENSDSKSATGAVAAAKK